MGEWLTWPWLVFGSNAIVAYVVSAILVKTFAAFTCRRDRLPNGKPLTGGDWVYWHIFASHGSTNNTSAAFAIGVRSGVLYPELDSVAKEDLREAMIATAQVLLSARDPLP